MTMAHIRSIGSLLSGHPSHGNNQSNGPSNDDVVKKGYLAKRKNMKNKYFVLRKETEDNPARLEYYDSEKKFLDGSQPKKNYILKDCFSISRKTDNKNYFVIALYINKDCIGLVTNNEDELHDWLETLQYHKNPDPEHIRYPRIEYEHVWMVDVLPRSLARKEGLTGLHYLCLKSRHLSLVRVNDQCIKKEFRLSTVKKCGFYDQFFFFQLGRFSCIGCGELYMKTEDSFIAQSIHNAVGSAMNSCNRTSSMTEPNTRERTISDPQSDVGPRSRERADSVPNNPRRHHPARGDGGLISFEIMQPQRQITDFGNGRHHIAGFDEGSRQQTPDEGECFALDEDCLGYIVMDQPPKNELIPPIINSPKGLLGDSKSPTEDDGSYVKMGSVSGERHPPNTLGVSPRGIIPSSHSGVPSPSSGSTSLSQGSSTPVSPSVSGGCPLFWDSGSPQTSMGFHSRSTCLIDDAYVPMVSPGSSQGPQISVGQSEIVDSSRPYVDMGPPPPVANIGSDQRKNFSTPTPIPLSPSDEDSYYDMFGNSGSSSCTSGTPSDLRIHEIAGDERGQTPHSGMWSSGLNSNYCAMDEPDSIACPRSARTNSVGSKTENFKRKNRLEPSAPIVEPSRVRAFSVGSHMPPKYGVGRHGGSGTPHHGSELPTGVLGDIYPSIKECGKQAKSKSSSAPMLTAPMISHSWSGTPGAYLRNNIIKEPNKMEMDFSKNKSYDFIPSDERERDRKTSKERLLHTLTGNRLRTNSKSSGGSSGSKLGMDSWGSGGCSKDRRVGGGEIDYSNRGIEIPYLGNDRNENFDLSSSPRSSNSDPMKGYLPMHPLHSYSSSFSNTGELVVGKRGPRTSSLNDACFEMSSSLSSCASQDDYVPMTGGGGSIGALTIASSSSSSNSINIGPVTGRPRRTSNIYAPVSASQELSSPIEDPDVDEERENWAAAEEGKKKSKKISKKKSLRDSTKRKKGDGGGSTAGGGDSPEVPTKSKSQSALATLTNLITRKPNNNNNTNNSTLKAAPLSPKGSPLPPKGSVKDSTSPFSSLKRMKSKDKEKDAVKERDSVSLAGDLSSSSQGISAASPTSLSPQNSLRRRTLGGIDTSPPPPSFFVPKGEEKMLLNPLEGRLLLRQKSREGGESDAGLKRRSALPNLEESSSGSLPSLSTTQKSATAVGGASTTVTSSSDNRNYVNMQPGTSSPQLSPSPEHKSSPKHSFKEASQPRKPPAAPQDNYMMMGGGPPEEEPRESRVPTLPSAVTKRPEIPHTLLSSHSQSPPPPISLEKLSLREDKPTVFGSSSERSRSHSGPGAPEGTKTNKKVEDSGGRAASACSSPISYSPPMSPTLGSVSSMSSLSEGGLSSASSTCTVVNVGVRNASLGTVQLPPPPKSASASSVPSTEAVSASYSCGAAKESQTPGSRSTASSGAKENSNSAASRTDEEVLNYVALDLEKVSNNSNIKTSTGSPKLGQKNSGSNAGSLSRDNSSTGYVEIDFKKSEGLRNTSLERETKRPH